MKSWEREKNTFTFRGWGGASNGVGFAQHGNTRIRLGLEYSHNELLWGEVSITLLGASLGPTLHAAVLLIEQKKIYVRVELPTANPAR